MKLNCDKLRQARRKRMQAECEWEPWFAWFPVRIREGDCRWLEYVERKRWWSHSDIVWASAWATTKWEYRVIDG
jgi:hypothetical protein